MVPFLNRANQSIEELREGYVKIKMPFRGNENHAGFMYAGSLFTLGESSILPLIMASFGIESMDWQIPVVGTYTINYLKPATSDMFLEVGFSP